MRASQRKNHQLRNIEFIPHFTRHAEGSVLSCFGDTKVLCTASLSEGLPRWRDPEEGGWITAEYSMLPRSTHERMTREVMRGKQSGRSMEIQRLIGRSLRAAVNLPKLGEYTLIVDCDVIQADGGTRTAAISGGFVALALALNKIDKNEAIIVPVAAISVGIYQDQIILDLDYQEDSQAQTDMNVVMNGQGRFIEIQGTAEQGSFDRQQMNQMLELAQQGIEQIMAIQKNVLNQA